MKFAFRRKVGGIPEQKTFVAADSAGFPGQLQKITVFVVAVVGKQGYLTNLKALVAMNQSFIRHQIGQQENASPKIIFGDFIEWQRPQQRCKKVVVIDRGHTVNIGHETVHQCSRFVAHRRQGGERVIKIDLAQGIHILPDRGGGERL